MAKIDTCKLERTEENVMSIFQLVMEVLMGILRAVV